MNQKHSISEYAAPKHEFNIVSFNYRYGSLNLKSPYN